MDQFLCKVCDEVFIEKSVLDLTVCKTCWPGLVEKFLADAEGGGSPEVEVKRYSTTWENVGMDTGRLKTPGGWVVHSGYESSVAMCFVPDPNHEWILEEKE